MKLNNYPILILNINLQNLDQHLLVLTQYCRNGQFTEADDYLDQIIQDIPELDKELLSIFNTVFADKYTEAMEIAKIKIQQYHEKENSLLYFLSIVLEGYVKWILGELNSLNENILIADQLLEKFEVKYFDNLKFFRATLLNIKGIYYTSIAKLSKSVEAYEEAISIAQEYNQRLVATYYNNLGESYRIMGEIDSAENAYLKSYELSKSQNDEIGINIDLSNLSHIAFMRGDYKKAKKLKLQSMDTKRHLAHIAEDNFSLIRIALKLNDKELLEKAFRNLALQAGNPENTSNFHVQAFYQLSRALKYLASGRLRDSVKAEAIFSEVCEYENLPLNLRVFSHINHVTILLNEVKLNGSNEALEEALDYARMIYKISENSGAPTYAIEALILKSKFILVQGDISNALSLLRQAKTMADKNNLKTYSLNAEDLIHEIEGQAEYWDNLLSTDVSITKRLQETKILDYINDAKRMISS